MSFNAVIPRFEIARLMDLPAGMFSLRISGRRSYMSTLHPFLARYIAITGPDSPPPTMITFSFFPDFTLPLLIIWKISTLHKMYYKMGQEQCE